MIFNPISGSVPFDPQTEVNLYDDFVGSLFGATNLGDLTWDYVVANNGTVVQDPNYIVNRPGIVRLTTDGVTASSSAYLRLLSCRLPGTAPWTLKAAVKTLGVVAAGVWQVVGFCDNTTGGGAAEATDGVYFRNSGANWFAVCSRAGVRTTVDTTIPATAGTWYRFKIIYSGTSAMFLIDDVLRATIITNTPLVGVWLHPWIWVNDGTGATAISLSADYWHLLIASITR